MYSYDYDYGYSDGLTADIIAPVLISTIVIMLFFSLLFYYLEAAAIYKMAKNRGISGAGLVFIPIIGTYMYGKLADTISKDRTGKGGGLAAFYLICSLIIAIASIVAVVFFASFFIDILEQLIKYDDVIYLGSSFAPMIILITVVPLISVVAAIIRYVIIYKIYSDYTDNNAAVYLVLSILFPIIVPFVLLSVKNGIPNSKRAPIGYNGYQAGGYNPQYQGYNPQAAQANPAYQNYNPQAAQPNPAYQNYNPQATQPNPTYQNYNPQAAQPNTDVSANEPAPNADTYNNGSSEN